jgi:hypothetical protein
MAPNESAEGSEWSWTAAPAIPDAAGHVLVKLLAYDGEYSVSYVYDHPKASASGQVLYQADTWLADLWRMPDGRLYAAGQGGGVHSYFGGRWDVTQTPESSMLSCIWGLSEEALYATADGAILRREGNVWRYFTKGHGAYLDYIRGSSQNDLYAVGRAGLLLHFDGLSWQRVQPPTNADLNAVCVVDPARVYIVGDHGVVLVGAKNSWSIVHAGEVDLVDVGVYQGNLYIAASDSGLLRLEGHNVVSVRRDMKPVRLRADDTFLCAAGALSFHRFDGSNWEDYTYTL